MTTTKCPRPTCAYPKSRSTSEDLGETVTSIAVRSILYTILFAAVGFLPSLDAATNPFDRSILFTEYSFTQLGQSIALMAGILSAGLLLCLKILPQLSFLIVALLTCALVREADTFLDYVVDGLWQTIVALILGAVAIQLASQRKAIRAQVAWLGQHFSLGLMLAGFVIVMGFARVFGRGVMWHEIMGEHYTKTIKYFAEESIELMGYAILTIGVVEFSVASLRQFRESRIMDGLTDRAARTELFRKFSDDSGI